MAGALGDFDQLWEVLSPNERARVVELIVESVTYDGTEGKLAITYRATGLRTFANEIALQTLEAA